MTGSPASDAATSASSITSGRAPAASVANPARESYEPLVLRQVREHHGILQSNPLPPVRKPATHTHGGTTMEHGIIINVGILIGYLLGLMLGAATTIAIGSTYYEQLRLYRRFVMKNRMVQQYEDWR